MKNKLLTLIVTLPLFAGCAGNVCTPVYKTDYVGPPDALLVKVPVEAPPDPSTYGTLTWKQRTALWETKYAIQTNNVATANRHTAALEDWKQQNNAVFATPATGASNAGGTSP